MTDTSDLRKLAVDLAAEAPRVGAAISAEIRKSGERVKKAAQATVPTRTHDLQNSIGVDLYGSGNSTKGMTAVVGPSEYYGRFVEFGTAKMEPHPYMQPAYDAEEPALEAAIVAIAEGVLK